MSGRNFEVTLHLFIQVVIQNGVSVPAFIPQSQTIHKLPFFAVRFYYITPDVNVN